MLARKQTTRYNGPAAVESIPRQDRRANLPTGKIRGLVADKKQAPNTILYPRGLSLAPQLTWKEKDTRHAKNSPPPSYPTTSSIISTCGRRIDVRRAAVCLQPGRAAR